MFPARRYAPAAVLALALAAPTLAAAPGAGYAVVVSRAARDDPRWEAVVRALIEAHDADVLAYGTEVDEVLPRLRELFPRHACFVARPEEAGREFVARVHGLVRRLDDDPYADARWGLLTGRDAKDALRIARHAEPLTVRRVAAATEVALEMCEQGAWYSELRPRLMVEKRPGDVPREREAPADTTATLIDALNDGRADLFITSGHATERDWQIGYGYRNGQFRCRDGMLYGLDTRGREFPIHSPNPKVYLAVGNCLMGHVDGREAMALAWMGDGGVYQMVGYTDLTWYGYGGWGCLDTFLEQPGRFTLAEAFLANHHALVHRLEADDTAGLTDFDRRGLRHDRDTIAFYGDPAWEAWMADRPKAWDQALTISADGLYTFVVTPRRGADSFRPINTNGSQRGGRPIVQFLPHRVTAVEVVEGAELQPMVADDFLLVPNPGACDPTRQYRVSFRAKRIDE